MMTILDYGLGNIRAFANVYRRLNVDVQYASNEGDLLKASKIILPGVGAFDHAINKLNESGLRDCLENLVINKNIPVLGVCVGMQILAQSSEEGSKAGLGWIKASVKRFETSEWALDSNYPIPHMGWNNLTSKRDTALLANLDELKRFYFLHSYYMQCEENADLIATANYGLDFACIINKQNIYGIQCHPEKSHNNGTALLKNFAEIS